MKRTKTSLFFVAVLGLILVVSQDAIGLEYEIIDLGTLGGSESKAYGINEYGQIVGSAETSSGQTRAFIYEDGVMSSLGALGGNMSEAFGINDNGQIVGSSVNLSGQKHAFLYEEGVMYDLGTLGGNESYAGAINNNGQIACTAQIPGGLWRSARYEDGQMKKLPTFSGSSWNSTCSDINADGVIAGYSDVTGGSPWHACVWDGNTIMDLGTLPGTSKSIARGINDNGQVVGYSNNYPNPPFLGFLYEDGSMSGIGSLGYIPDDTRANSINNNGEIVGWSKTVNGYKHAFVYMEGVMTDLGTLGGNTSEAWGINDSGWIVGWAETAEGDIHAVLWMPSLLETAIVRIKEVIAEKQAALEAVDAILGKERQAYDALEELLESGDYGDLNKRDIVKAKQEIHSAMQRQERSLDALEKSIEGLYDALVALGWEPNLVSHWKFDEGSGTIAYDSAGNNDGTLNGDPNWTTGQVDGALSFDGVDDYVDVGSAASLELGSFTISAWIKPSDLSSVQQIAGKLGNEPVHNRGYGYRLEIRDGKASLLIDPTGCCNPIPVKSVTSLEVGQWYFVAGTYGGSTGTIYVDGQPENSDLGTLDAYYTNFFIGARRSDYHSAFYDHFSGVIDEVRVYDRALSAEEIQELYLDGLSGSGKGKGK